MKHLSGTDAAFLYLESAETPMHVGGLYLVDLPANYQGDYYEAVKSHIAARMHLIPVFQRKLALMPFELANPVWVDEPDIDLDYHIRRIVLSKPGSMAQLEAYVGRLHSSLMDRSRPLWEFYIIEGLASGQIGVYSRVHHAAVDGQAAVAMANATLDPTPEPRPVKRRVVRRRPDDLGLAELIAAALGNAAVQTVKLAKLLPAMASSAGAILLPKGEDGKRHLPKVKQALSMAPRCILNGNITNQRIFASLSLPLPEVKRLAKASGTTLNDIVLAICASALRRYLLDYDALPAKPLVAAVPVSLRAAGNTDMSNQVTNMACSLATDIADPLARLQAINQASKRAKAFTNSMRAAIPTDFPSLGAPWLASGLLAIYNRSNMASVLPPFYNVAISNVPGSPVPLYLAGARIREWHPVSIAMLGIALNITVQSYADALNVGFTACRKAVPDLRELADYVRDGLDELSARLPPVALAAIEEAAPIPTISAPPRLKAGRLSQARSVS